jgi:hypothetical protein
MKNFLLLTGEAGRKSKIKFLLEISLQFGRRAKRGGP